MFVSVYGHIVSTDLIKRRIQDLKCFIRNLKENLGKSLKS